MTTYAQIKDGEVVNLAIFIGEPPRDFAGFDAHVLVPDDLPVAIGCTWDGVYFRDADGEIVIPIEPSPEPEADYDEHADMQAALGLLGVTPEVT